MSHDAAKLDATLIWEHDHLSAVALQALVDGELSLLPAQACEHAERCAPCAERLGQLALTNLAIDDTLDRELLALSSATAAAKSRAAAKPRSVPVRSLPVVEILCALLLAVLGRLPALQAVTPARIPHTLRDIIHLSVRVLEHVAGTDWGPSLPWLAAALLLFASACVGFAARRGLTRRLPSPPS